jgi:Gluconate 2-dehydrogenase subunit 3
MRRPMERPDHLPNLRPGRRPPPPSWLPRQRRGTTPQMIGRYPDFDVLEEAAAWDPVTRRTVLARLGPAAPLRFFTPREEPALRAFCDMALAQDAEPRVPVAEMVDAKLASGRLDGFQYAGLPDDREIWRRVLAGLDESARERGVEGYAACDARLRWAIAGRLEDGTLAAAALTGLDVSRAWSVCMRMVLAAFYSHPWAWNEIGFGGPAYPRGFMRTGPLATREPFERPGAVDVDPVRDADAGGA